LNKTDPVIKKAVKIKYSGKNTMMVTGKVTGLIYIFAPGERALKVDSRDVVGLLAKSTDFALS